MPHVFYAKQCRMRLLKNTNLALLCLFKHPSAFLAREKIGHFKLIVRNDVMLAVSGSIKRLIVFTMRKSLTLIRASLTEKFHWPVNYQSYNRDCRLTHLTSFLPISRALVWSFTFSSAVCCPSMLRRSPASDVRSLRNMSGYPTGFRCVSLPRPSLGSQTVLNWVSSFSWSRLCLWLLIIKLFHRVHLVAKLLPLSQRLLQTKDLSLVRILS